VITRKNQKTKKRWIAIKGYADNDIHISQQPIAKQRKRIMALKPTIIHKLNAMQAHMTPDSLATFLLYAEDAGNWSGVPWVSIGNIRPTKEQRGNLSDLVKKGFIQIFEDDGDKYIQFTESGKNLAEKHGYKIG